jgi:hypothetical protein
MSDVATMNGSVPAIHGADPYSSYGAKVGTQGTFLTFKNGEYLAGQDAKEIPLGTKLAANMPGLRIGWRRWFADQLTDDRTILLIEQNAIEPRNMLGDADPDLWETDNTGKKRDPWQLTNVLEMVDGEGESYIYATGSKGGIGAIGRLCKEYGKAYRQRPGQVPIVELGRDSYMHKEFGKTYFPVFTIVGWTDENSLTIEGGDNPEPSKAEPTPPAAAAAPANKKARF